MRKVILSAAATIALAASAMTADAAPLLVAGVDHPGDAVLEKAQYFYLGRNWCWYDSAWRGPGFYWCGYAYRRGFGWGGPAGWRGWHGPGYWRGGVWAGPRGYAHPDWRGWHGGGGRGGYGGGGHGGGHCGGGHGGGGGDHHH
jgi:hypothetical protein